MFLHLFQKLDCTDGIEIVVSAHLYASCIVVSCHVISMQNMWTFFLKFIIFHVYYISNVHNVYFFPNIRGIASNIKRDQNRKRVSNAVGCCA